VVSGLPLLYERHAPEMARLALELMDSVKEHHIHHMPEETLKLRVGLHSGKNFIFWQLQNYFFSEWKRIDKKLTN
jgi:hypothetical protein